MSREFDLQAGASLKHHNASFIIIGCDTFDIYEKAVPEICRYLHTWPYCNSSNISINCSAIGLCLSRNLKDTTIFPAKINAR